MNGIQRAADIRFIGSEIYRHSSYGRKHPLAIPRVSTCMDLCHALGWLDESVYLDSPRASPAQLARFHEPAYVAAVETAEAEQGVSEAVRRRYGLGANGNPIFPEVFRRPATACGGSVAGAERLLNGARIVYSPAGGTHHGRPARASGFCYFNDPVLAILRLLDGGVGRVLYVDIDAHHGDGVQDAFHDDGRVLTVSVHEDGRWPMSAPDPGHIAVPGGSLDRAGGMARNMPVPVGFNDTEMDYVVEAGVLPLAAAFEPTVVVLQAGCDAVADDPLSGLSLSNLALWRAVRAVRDVAPRLLCLGGGGYNPWAVGRAWAGVWATLCSRTIPDALPPAARDVLGNLTWQHSRGRSPPATWFTTLADTPRTGPIRPDVRAAVARAMAAPHPCPQE
jgi:acetoin utilization protein AcuC